MRCVIFGASFGEFTPPGEKSPIKYGMVHLVKAKPSSKQGSVGCEVRALKCVDAGQADEICRLLRETGEPLVLDIDLDDSAKGVKIDDIEMLGKFSEFKLGLAGLEANAKASPARPAANGPAAAPALAGAGAR